MGQGSSDMSGTAARSQRSDARRNADRILEAAASLFAEAGADTSMTAIARQAEVGVGTLYRHFPTREDLVEAVHRKETERLSRWATELVSSCEPTEAFVEWTRRFMAYMAAKEAMADALPAILSLRSGLKSTSRDAIRAAIATLLEAGSARGVWQEKVSADDVMMSLGGIALIAAYEDDSALPGRLVTMLIDGLRVRG